MAIEFNCPFCTATVRVGNDASGRIGRCPKCETRIRVPVVRPPEESAARFETPRRSVDETPSDQDIPLFSPAKRTNRGVDQPQFPSPGPAGSAPQPDSGGDVPIIRTREDPATLSPYLRKRRKRSSLAGLVPPLIFGGLLLVIAGLFWLWTRPSFEGALAAVRVDPGQAFSRSIDGARFNLSKEIFAELTDELRERPASIRSNLVNLSFSGGPRGVTVTLRPGPQADMVKVPLLSIPSIAGYYGDRYDELEDARLAEMQAALDSLSREWVRAPEERKTATLPEYRYELAYNAFVFGLGRICEAVAGNQRYPCVHEDAEGFLYFLIPAGARTFRIRERTDVQTTPFFPSKFEILVDVPERSDG